MKFSPKSRTMNFGIVFTIVESFCCFFRLERAPIGPKLCLTVGCKRMYLLGSVQ